MLVGISPLISPSLLETLHRMGHGDEIVFADAHFPAESLGPRCIRADGLCVTDLLDAVLPLLALDDYVDAPATMMATVAGDSTDPVLEASYQALIAKHWPKTPPITMIERFDFYARAGKAFAIVASGDTAKYANIILKKGVTPSR
ncbi:MAG: L-fucose mutarotase [Verrucomicrobiales bacterium]|jgi:L-fucose mutarotase